MKPNLRRLFNKLFVAAKDFAASGARNILRGFFTVASWIITALITTTNIYGNAKFLTVLRCLFLNFKIWVPFLVSGIVYGILTMMIKMNPDNMVERYNGKNKDENGVQMARNGTYGTAGWMPKKEAYEKLEVEDIAHCNGVILGGYDTEGREVVCVPRGTKETREITNQNVCIFGSPGEGKSWGYARCNMLQAIRRGESVVVTDPKGELFRDTAKLFRDNGYCVKVFNLANPKKSDAWNCMDVCYNKETGNVDLNRVKIFVEAIMKNTSNPSDKDDYFASNERTLYEAVIMYMAEKYCIEYRSKLDQIVKKTNTRDNRKTYYEYCIKYARSDSSMKEMISSAKEIFVKYGPSDELIADVRRIAGEGVRIIETAVTPEQRAAQFDEYLKYLTEPITKPTLSNVYYKLNKINIEEFKKEVDDLNCPTALCHIPLNIILMQSNSVWPNFTNGCNVRLNVLNDEMLRLMVSEDDIDLSAPGRQKCAYFCIFPDQDFTFRFVSSLFFTFLFKDQIETADNSGGNPVAINYILDEFANIGMIPDFSNKISTARSRNIGITIILQTITQLYQVYMPNVANTILGCCATLMCLGANDDMTIKYFVNLLGETTIIARSTKDDRQVGHMDSLFPEYSENLGEGKRNLLTFDEMRRIKATDLIVICAHMKPLLLKKLTAAIHPLSNKGRFEQTDINKILPFVDRYPGCEQRDLFAREAYERLCSDIQNLEAKRAAVAAETQSREAGEGNAQAHAGETGAGEGGGGNSAQPPEAAEYEAAENPAPPNPQELTDKGGVETFDLADEFAAGDEFIPTDMNGKTITVPERGNENGCFETDAHDTEQSCLSEFAESESNMCNDEQYDLADNAADELCEDYSNDCAIVRQDGLEIDSKTGEVIDKCDANPAAEQKSKEPGLSECPPHRTGDVRSVLDNTELSQQQAEKPAKSPERGIAQHAETKYSSVKAKKSNYNANDKGVSVSSLRSGKKQS